MHKTTFKLTTMLIAAALLASGPGCETDETQKLPKRNWQLSWSDDFEGAAGTQPDPAKWVYDTGTGQGGWGNQELQYYTNRPQNVSMDGSGNLVITARQESYLGSAFTSGRIKTQGVFQQQYGRFEARIQTPFGPGLWPAFWMLGSNITTVPWPQCGEIDILEQRGQEPHVIHGTIHGPGYSGGNSVSGAFALRNGRFDTGFHEYAVEWFPDRIDYFIDGFLYYRINRSDVEGVRGEWVYDQPFFMILNIAVGGNFVGFPTTATRFPQQMLIDYVRVYTLAD
jgi:beta-glucanase (GH16 family)